MEGTTAGGGGLRGGGCHATVWVYSRLTDAGDRTLGSGSGPGSVPGKPSMGMPRAPTRQKLVSSICSATCASSSCSWAAYFRHESLSREYPSPAPVWLHVDISPSGSCSIGVGRGWSVRPGPPKVTHALSVASSD